MEEVVVIAVPPQNPVPASKSILTVPSPSSSSSDLGSVPRSPKNRLPEKGSDEYRKRRERNNIAVRKSRSKSKQKTEDTLKKINFLRAENAKLEERVQLLSKELCVLKDLFLSHAQDLPDPSATYEVFNKGTENTQTSEVDKEEEIMTVSQVIEVPSTESKALEVNSVPLSVTEAVVPSGTRVYIIEDTAGVPGAQA